MEEIQTTASRKTARVFQPTVLFHSDGRNLGENHEQQQNKTQSLVWPYMMSLQNYINFPFPQLQVAGSNTNLSSRLISKSNWICPLGCSASSCPDQAHLSSLEHELKSVPPQQITGFQATNLAPTLQSTTATETSESLSVIENVASSIMKDSKTTETCFSVQHDNQQTQHQETQNQDAKASQAMSKHSEGILHRKQNPAVSKKKLKCPFCSVSCSNHGQLRGHLRCHTGEKPFVCTFDGCTKQFARNEELTRHKRIHTGIRPFNCSTCKKTFGRKDHLQKHLKTHLEPGDKKVFICTVCHQGYSRSDALTRHKGTAHSEPRLNIQEK